MASPNITTLAAELTVACSQLEHADGNDPALQYETRNKIAGHARRILMETSSPSDFMWIQMSNLYTLTSVRTLSQQGVLKAFPSSGGISLAALSQQSGVQESLLKRLLRVLVVTQFFGQDELTGEYFHTSVSRAFCEAEPLQLVLDALSEHVLTSVGRLPEYLAARQSAVEPTEQDRNPYTWSRGHDGTSVWQVMAANGELARFQSNIVQNPVNKLVFPPTGFYDFSALTIGDLGDRDVLVDVGGGTGAILTEIINNTPALQAVASKCVLQDLEGPVGQATAGGTLPAGLRTMSHNFFSEQPIKGAKAYYLRRILHDYSDEKCVEILKQIAQAAAPDSKVLLSELVDPMTNTEADIPMVCTDFTMLNIGGKERSESQFAVILEGAGLKLQQVWRGKADCVVEAVLQ